MRYFLFLLVCVAGHAQGVRGGALRGAVVRGGGSLPRGAPTLISSTWCAATGAASCTTAAVNCTGATVLVVGAGNYSASATGITLSDSSDNTGYSASTDQVQGSVWHAAVFVKSSPTVSSSMTWTAQGNYVQISVACFSGTSGGIDRDVGGGSSNTNAFVDVGPISPTSSGSLLIASAYWQINHTLTGLTGASSWTVLESHADANRGAGMGCTVLPSGSDTPRLTWADGNFARAIKLISIAP